jgi:ABC-type branched-subunit amino acid transport system substrate-binding protein
LDFSRAVEQQAHDLEKQSRPVEAARVALKGSEKLAGAPAARLAVYAYKLFSRAGRLEEAALALDRFGAEAEKQFERVFAARKLASLVERLGRGQKVVRLYRRTSSGSMLRYLLAPLVARFHLAQGNGKRAEQMLRSTAAGRRSVAALLAQGKLSRSRRIGCLVSLSGPYRRLSVSVMKGALLAADVFGAGTAGGLDVAVADVSEGGGAAIDDLAYRWRVAAAVGPVDPKRAAQAAERAKARDVPVVTVTPDEGVAAKSTFALRYLPNNGLRAQSLARAVMKRLSKGRGPKGSGGAPAGRAPSVGLIAPDTKTGKTMLEALEKEVSRLGGKIVVKKTYSPKATHFASLVGALKKARVEGVVAVAPARTLELLAPQLAAGGIWPGDGSAGSKRAGRRGGRREIVLGATGEGLTPKRLGRMSRYLQSALLCPGFYPSVSDPRWGGVVRAFKRAYGSVPDLLSAHVYEATVLLRQVLEAHPGIRGVKLSEAISKLKTAKGKPLFGEEGNLSRPPTVYEVVGVTLRKL